jgi:hypothetical protein
MAKRINRAPVNGGKSLELIMRDTMEGLVDSATYFAYRSNPDVMEILSIEPAKTLNFEKKPANVVQLQPNRDITDYLIQRELKLVRVSSSVV